MAMNEETLVQEVTANYLLNQLQWDGNPPIFSSTSS